MESSSNQPTCMLFFDVGLTMVQQSEHAFPFKINDVILAKYEGEIYYAKILSIHHNRKMARILFDDNSKDEVGFENIFNVNETTSDIICVVCKDDKTETDNDIVLCDQCNVGYHQHCHLPEISSNVLLPEVPWECRFCAKKEENPYVEGNPFQEMLLEDSIERIEKPLRLKISTKKEGYQVHIKDDFENTKDFPPSPGNQYKDRVQTVHNAMETENSNIDSELEKRSKTQKQHSDIVERNLTVSEKKLERNIEKCNIDNEYSQETDEDNTFPTDDKMTVESIEKDPEANNNAHNQHCTIQNDQQQSFTQCKHSDGFDFEQLDNTAVGFERRASLQKVKEQKHTINSKDKTSKNDHWKKKKSLKLISNGSSSDSCFDSQSRYAKDLPRHNWLVERLKAENKLAATEIEQLELQLKTQNEADEKESKKLTKPKENEAVLKKNDNQRKNPVDMRNSDTVKDKKRNKSSPAAIDLVSRNSNVEKTEDQSSSTKTHVREPQRQQRVSPTNIVPISSVKATDQKVRDVVDIITKSSASNETKNSDEFNFKILKVESLSKAAVAESKLSPVSSDSSHQKQYGPQLIPRIIKTIEDQTQIHDKSPLPPPLLISPAKDGQQYATPKHNSQPSIPIAESSTSIAVFKPKILQNNVSPVLTNENGLMQVHYDCLSRNTKASPTSKNAPALNSQNSGNPERRPPLPPLEVHLSVRASRELLQQTIPIDSGDSRLRDVHQLSCDISHHPALIGATPMQQMVVQRRQERLKAIQLHRRMLQNQQLKLKELKHKIEAESQHRLLVFKSEMVLQRPLNTPDGAQQDRPTKSILGPRSTDEMKRIEIEKQLSMQKQWIEEHDTRRQLEDRLKKKTAEQVHQTTLQSPHNQKEGFQHAYLEKLLQQQRQQQRQQQQQQQQQHNEQQQQQHHPQQQQLHSQQRQQQQQQQHKRGPQHPLSPYLNSPPTRSKYEELLYLKRMERVEIARRNEMPISPQEHYEKQVRYENAYQRALDVDYYAAQRKVSPEMENRLMYQLQQKHDEEMPDMSSLEYERSLNSMNPRRKANRPVNPEIDRIASNFPIAPVSPGHREHLSIGIKRGADYPMLSPSAKISRAHSYISSKVSPSYVAELIPTTIPQSISRVYDGLLQSGENVPSRGNLPARSAYLDLTSNSGKDMVHTQARNAAREQHYMQLERLRQDREARCVDDRTMKVKSTSRCKVCGDAAQFLCSGCRDIWYCSQKCQHSHWRAHVVQCKRR